MGTLSVHDADEENTVNTLLTYKLLSQFPESEAMFSVDTNTGDLKVTKGGFRRSAISQYSLIVSVSDGGLPGTHTHTPHKHEYKHIFTDLNVIAHYNRPTHTGRDLEF